jgi:integrase/recombinase XerD
VLIAEKETVEMADVSGVGVSGPLGPFVAGFAAELSRQGYKPQPVGKQLGLVTMLSGWLAAEGVAVSGLVPDVAERFCAARRAAGYTDRATVRALDPLLGYLRALGAAPPECGRAPAGPVEELLSSFRRYLEQERGLVPAAARGYVDKVRPFVARFDGPDGLELWRVDVAEVRRFVVEVGPRLGRRAAQLTVVALRSLLR